MAGIPASLPPPLVWSRWCSGGPLRSWRAVAALPIVMDAGSWLENYLWCVAAVSFDCAPMNATPVRDYLLYGAQSLAILAVGTAVSVFLTGRARAFLDRDSGAAR